MKIEDVKTVSSQKVKGTRIIKLNPKVKYILSTTRPVSPAGFPLSSRVLDIGSFKGYETIEELEKGIEALQNGLYSDEFVCLKNGLRIFSRSDNISAYYDLEEFFCE